MKKSNFKKSIPLLIMFAPVLLYFIVFKYVPMFGLVLGFQNYRFKDGILGSEWVGLRNFKYIFNTPNITRVIGNTFRIGLLCYIVGFPMPILLALLINEVKNMRYKKMVQTLVYLPHFLSWVAVSGIVVTLFSLESGVINNIIESFGGKAYSFLYNTKSWLIIYLGSGVWKGMGWGAIVYLAALGGIDPELYESASIDGCGRWKKMFYISLPGLIPAIMVNLILSAGSILDVGFDRMHNMMNVAVKDYSNVIAIWSYNSGLKKMQFSMSTAMGLFDSVIGLILVVVTNGIAKRFKCNLW